MAVNVYEKPLLTQKRITPWTLPEDTIEKSLSAQQANYDKNRDAFMSVLDNIQQYKARPHVKGDMDYITNVYNEYKNRISSQLDQYGQNYGMLSPEMLIRATDEVLMPHKEQITGIAQNYYYWELEQKMDAEMRASGKDPLFRSEELNLKPTVDANGKVSVYPSTIEHRQDWDDAKEGYFEPIGSWLESKLGANPETVINAAGGWQQFYSTLRQDNKERLDAVINGGVDSYITENPQEFRSLTLDHVKAGKTQQEAEQLARQEIRNSFIWRGAKRRIEVIKEDVEIKSAGTGSGGSSSGSAKKEEDKFRPSSPATTNYTVEGLTIYDPKTPLEEQVQTFYKPFSIFTHNQDASFFDGSNSISNLNNIEAGKWKGISVGTGQKSTSAGATNLGVDTSGILQMLGNAGTYTVNGNTVNPVLSTISIDQLPQYITHLENNVLDRKLTEQEISTIRSNQLTPDNDKLLTISALEPVYNMETGEYETIISPFLQENGLLEQPAIDNLNKFMSNQKQGILAYNIEMTTMHKKAERLGRLEAELRQQYGWTKQEEDGYVARQLNNTSDIDKVNYLPEIGADLPRDFRKQIDPNKMLVEMSMNPTRAFIKTQAISEINNAITKEGKYYAKNSQFSKLMSNHEDGRELYGEPIYNWLKNQFGAETVKSMMANNINGMGQIFSEIDTSTDVGKSIFNDYHAQGRILENPNKPGKYLYLNQEIYDFMKSIPEEILLDDDQANQLKSYKPNLSEEEKKKRVPLIKASNPKYRNYITASNQLAEPYNIEGYIFAFSKDYENNNAVESRMMKYIMAANDDKIRRKQWDTTENGGKRKVTDKYNYQTEFTKSLEAHPEWGKKEDLAAKSMISLTGVRYDINDGFVLDFGFIDSEGTRQDLEYHGVEFVPQDLNDIGMIPSSAPNVMETLKQIEQTLEQNNNISGHIGTGHTKMPFFVHLTDDNTGLGRFKKGHFYTYDVNAANPADGRVNHRTISDLHDYYISSHKDYYGPLIELMKAKELFVQHPDVARMAYPQLWMKFQDENAILQNLDQSIRDLQDSKYTSQKTQDIRKNINISPEQKDLISKGEVGLAAKNANLFNIKDPTAKRDERGVAIPDSSNLFYSNGKLGVTQLGVDDEGHAIFSDPDQGALAGIQFLLKYYTAGTLKGTNTAYGKLPENAYDESGKIKLKAFRNKYATSQNGDTLIQKLRSNNVLDVNGQQVTDDTLLEDVEFDQIAYYFAVLEDANLINHLGGKNYIDQLIKKYKTLMD